MYLWDWESKLGVCSGNTETNMHDEAYINLQTFYLRSTCALES
jgi:hypothetical protein